MRASSPGSPLGGKRRRPYVTLYLEKNLRAELSLRESPDIDEGI